MAVECIRFVSCCRNIKTFLLYCLLQDDKDLVHAFVNNDGLECLVKIGAEADQNYQNYILRGEMSFC